MIDDKNQIVPMKVMLYSLALKGYKDASNFASEGVNIHLSEINSQKGVHTVDEASSNGAVPSATWSAWKSANIPDANDKCCLHLPLKNKKHVFACHFKDEKDDSGLSCEPLVKSWAKTINGFVGRL